MYKIKHIYRARSSRFLKKAKRRASFHLDAAGSFGMQYLPHLASVHAGEPERRDMLKISCMFKKVHGVGVFVDVVFPEIVIKGGALFLESVYRTLYTYMKVILNLHVRYNKYYEHYHIPVGKPWRLGYTVPASR